MGPPSPGPFPVGTTILEFTATNDDAPNETATCQYTVTVVDNEAPAITCPGDQNESFDTNCTFLLPDYSILASTTDICDPAPIITQTPAPGSVISATTTLTLTTTDFSGNSSSCNFDVILADTTPPVLSCPINQNESVDAGCMFTIPDYSNLATATDNCGNITFTQTPPPGTIVAIGTTAITLDVSDGTNSTSCNFNIIVEDTTPPEISCLNITIQLDEMGMASITTANINGGSSDNCGIDTISLSQTTFDCSDVGVNQITLSVIDTSGNTATCNALVTVEDTTAPVAICQNITVALDNGEVEIDPIDVDGGSNDACGIGSLMLDIDSFDCSNIGDNNVILTVTDENGNTSTCTAIVTVVETVIPPTAVCQNITVPLLPDGTATIPPESLNGGSLGLGCTGTFSVDIDTFDCGDIGDPIQVVMTITNPDGITDSCTAFVNVVDSLAPEIFCPDDQTVISDGTPFELPDYIGSGDVFAVDNCIDTTITQTPAAGTLLNPGTYPISFVATDLTGNEDVCIFTLTVEDEVLGIPSQVDLASVRLFPNPANNFINLSNPQQINIENVTVYDITGRVVKSFSVGNNLAYRFDISELASASYILLISTENGQLTKQIIKK
jgi:Secretion system C-terminal sorting domain/HYR domain